ncbi:MAG: chorismate synthase [Ruminococcaceae bacterium]|nr:chorismate synthase [Oscillospiraceae bacterium]
MKNVFGNSVTVTLAGESHGEAIVTILDGLMPGLAVDMAFVESRLLRRRPAGTMSTARREADPISIVSGVFEGRTTGTPLTIVIPNAETRSRDYEALRNLPRPGHADFTASRKYEGFQDYRGGGHFSGRVTVGLVAAGAIAELALRERGVQIGTHMASLGGRVSDRPFARYEADLAFLEDKAFPVLDAAAAEAMKAVIEEARLAGDSVGGVLETAVIGLDGGYGEPWFDTVESMLSHILFAIPAIKGVEFGDGFALTAKRGSEANDAFVLRDSRTVTETNRNGGINGGITNGMPILFRCAVKPTPSIHVPQKTVDMKTGNETTLSIGGRHDPCIVHRAAAVVNACTAIALLDLVTLRDGNVRGNR